MTRDEAERVVAVAKAALREAGFDRGLHFIRDEGDDFVPSFFASGIPAEVRYKAWLTAVPVVGLSMPCFACWRDGHSRACLRGDCHAEVTR